MIDEKKLIEELEKWMNDTAYLKEKYSGATQFKDGTGENIMYTHADIAHDVISEIIGKINEQQKVGEWIPCSERLPEEEQEVLLQFEDNMVVGFYFVEGGCFDGTTNWYGLADNDSYTDCDSKPIAWQPLPESYKPGKE